MSKKVVDTPIYVDTYKLVGIVYGLRFSIPKRDRAVLGDRILDAATAMLVEFTLSYKLRGNEKVVHTDRFLALMPELRKRLAELDVRLNEKKFFCQHFSKGIRCLGTMLKFGRMYLNRTTVNRAFARLREWADRRYIPIDERNNMLCSLNTYCGMMKRGNNRNVLQRFMKEGLCSLGRFLVWNEKKLCFGLKKMRL